MPILYTVSSFSTKTNEKKRKRKKRNTTSRWISVSNVVGIVIKIKCEVKQWWVNQKWEEKKIRFYYISSHIATRLHSNCVHSFIYSLMHTKPVFSDDFSYSHAYTTHTNTHTTSRIGSIIHFLFIFRLFAHRIGKCMRIY